MSDVQAYQILYTAKQVEEFLTKIDNMEHELKDSNNPICSKAVLTKFEELRKTVNDGKTLVANAITEKGVNTESNNTFAEMASNILAIQTGSSNDDSFCGNLMASLVKEIETITKKAKEILTEAEILEKSAMKNFAVPSNIKNKNPKTILTEAEILEKIPMSKYAIPAYIEGYEAIATIEEENMTE